MEKKTTVIANWKMNLDLNASVQLAQSLRMEAETRGIPAGTNVVICPSFDSLATVAELLEGSGFAIGAQDVFWQERGAYTGEISASMLKALGATYVIIGHSERRKYLGEDDSMVNKKVRAALAVGLIPVVCVGETYEERTAGHTELILMRQVIEGLQGIPLERSDRIIIAYEPVWVIGTGQAIDPPMANHASRVIRQSLIDVYSGDVSDSQCMILYGGSVDEKNIGEYVGLPHIHGVLVGTASLRADGFFKLIHSL